MSQYLGAKPRSGPALLFLATSSRTGADARLLVEKLIRGKGSDQEKFDAIYTWVSTNIR